MALTRKLLRSMGIEDDKIDQIIEAHTETVNALKDERDEYKDAAGQLPELRKKLKEFEDKPNDGFKEKYEKEHAEFEAFKAEMDKANSEREKRSLYRKILQDAGIDPKRIDSVMRVADLSEIKVKDGAVVDADKVAESVKREWGDFIQVGGAKPAGVDTPPANEPGKPEPKNLAEALRMRYSSTD